MTLISGLENYIRPRADDPEIAFDGDVFRDPELPIYFEGGDVEKDRIGRLDP